MSLNMQVKLLRVLQEKRYRRVGGTSDINCNERIIAALNEDPMIAMSENRLRKDLYYRISTVVIGLSSLKERIDDIECLSNFFINKLSKIYFKNIKSLSDEVISIFRNYDWPGNIRELYHVLEYCANIMEFDELNRSIYRISILLSDY